MVIPHIGNMDKSGLLCWAVVVHAFNSSTWEAEAGGSLGVQGHPGLHKINAETDPGGGGSHL